jgi:glycosyltransferase involved in cell wall biosynthesis
MPYSVSRNEKIKKWLVVDQTKRQFYEDNRSPAIDAKLRHAVYRREAFAYQACEGIIAFNRWASSSIVADYGAPADKVFVVVPGANFDPSAYDIWHQSEAAAAFIRRLESPFLRVVFCGNDSYGKGLDRLIDGVSWAKARGFRGRLTIYGSLPEAVTRQYSSRTNIEFAGFINKEKEPLRFIRLLADNDVGCLVSRKEAGGGVVCEFAALGLPTIITRVGGIPDTAIAAASIALPGAVTPEVIGETLLELESDRCLRERLQRAAWEAHETALWSASIAKIRRFWPYPPDEFPPPSPTPQAKGIVHGIQGLCENSA